MNCIKLENILRKIIVILFAVYVCQNILLAFATQEYNPTYHMLILSDYYLCLFTGIIYIFLKKKISKEKIIWVILPCTYWILLSLSSLDTYKGEWIIPLIIIISYITFEEKLQIDIFKFFYWIIITTNIIAILIFICFVFQINIGFNLVPYYNNDEYSMYAQWEIFAIYIHGLSVRLCSIFNEPGGLGTICALLFVLGYEKIRLWEKCVLFITGSLTFSFAFWLMIIIFFMIKLYQKNKSNVIIIFGCIMFILAVPHIDFGNDGINALAKRFEVTSNGVAGDNRLAGSEIQYKKWLISDDILWGLGGQYKSNGGAGVQVSLLMPYGIIGTGIMIFEWIIFMLYMSKGRRESLIFSLLFLLSIYQRSYVLYALYGYVLVIGGLKWQQINEKNTNK